MVVFVSTNTSETGHFIHACACHTMYTMLSRLALRLLLFVFSAGQHPSTDELSSTLLGCRSATSARDTQPLRRWLEFWLEQVRVEEEEGATLTNGSSQLQRLTVSAYRGPPVRQPSSVTDDDAALPNLWERFWLEVVPRGTSLILEGLRASPDRGSGSLHFNAGLVLPVSSVPPLQLTHLSLAGCPLTTELCTSVASLCTTRLPVLSTLVLDATYLTTSCLQVVLAALARRLRHGGCAGPLQCLSVRANLLDANVLPAVATALYDDATTLAVDLADNPLLIPIAGPTASPSGEHTGTPSEATEALAALILALGTFSGTRRASTTAVGSSPDVALSLRGCTVTPLTFAALRTPRQATGAALSLRALDLSFTPLGDEGVQQLAAAVRHADALVHLETLCVRGVGCGPVGLRALTALLAGRRRSLVRTDWQSASASTRAAAAGEATARPWLPLLRRLDASQHDLSDAQGLRAAAALTEAMIARHDRDAAHEAETKTDAAAAHYAVVLEACQMHDVYVEALLPLLTPAPPCVESSVPRFLLCLGMNALSRDAVVRLYERLRTRAAAGLIDVYVEGNPLAESAAHYRGDQSACPPTMALTACTDAALDNAVRRLHSAVLVETAPERVAPVESRWHSHATPTATSRRASMRTDPSLAQRRHRAASSASQAETCLEWRSVPSLSPPTAAPAPPCAVDVCVSGGTAPESESPPSPDKGLTDRLRVPPHTAHFLDATEVAQLMAETDAIMRDRLDVMAGETSPFRHEPAF